MAKRYTEEEIERGLTELALCGGDRNQAHKRLKQAGVQIPAETLRSWATRTYPDRYQQIRADRAAKIAERIANEAEDFALGLARAERTTLGAYEARLEQDAPPPAEPGEDPKDYQNRLAAWAAQQASTDKLASSLRNLTTSKSLNVDRVASPLRGRPTTIIEHRSVEELARKLERADIIEGTAEEMDKDTELQALTTRTAG